MAPFNNGKSIRVLPLMLGWLGVHATYLEDLDDDMEFPHVFGDMMLVSWNF